MRRKTRVNYEIGIVKVKSNKDKTSIMLNKLYSRGWRLICSYSEGNYLILEREEK